MIGGIITQTMISRIRNDIATDISRKIAKRRYKNCSHLFIQSRVDGFQTGCREHSFQTQTDRNPEIHRVMMGLFEEPDLRCPYDCAYFKDKEEALREKKRQQRWERIKKPFAFCWSEFKELHWAVELGLIAIFFLIVLWFAAPSLIPQFIELIKAIRGG